MTQLDLVFELLNDASILEFTRALIGLSDFLEINLVRFQLLIGGLATRPQVLLLIVRVVGDGLEVLRGLATFGNHSQFRARIKPQISS